MWYSRGPTGDCLASGDWESRLGKLHQDPPRLENGIRDGGLRARDQPESEGSQSRKWGEVEPLSSTERAGQE